MLKFNKNRPGCRDVFNAFLTENARFSRVEEFPVLPAARKLPGGLVSFSKALNAKTGFDRWIHFYEDDSVIERVWNNPRRYLPVFKRFAGVIHPDFSVYRDMPLAVQKHQIFKSRSIGFWLSGQGVSCIPNLRFADERTYDACCEGVAKNSVVALGTHGCFKNVHDRFYLFEGLDRAVEVLTPSHIVIYGPAPEAYFKKYEEAGIVLLRFCSEIGLARGKES